MGVAIALGIALQGSACLGRAPQYEEIQDPDVISFAQRLQAFYGSIQNIPLDVRLTYDSSVLRTFFASDEEFAAYYASIAAQLRRAQFRNCTLERVSIVEFRFEKDDVAQVDLMLFGRHERTLRFGELELQRVDVWERRNGNWVVTPGKI